MSLRVSVKHSENKEVKPGRKMIIINSGFKRTSDNIVPVFASYDVTFASSDCVCNIFNIT